MRILAWSSSYWPALGGGPVLGAALLPALAARGHEIVVVTDRRPDGLPEREERDGIAIHRLPFRRALGGELAAVPALRRRVAALKQALRPQLVHLWAPGYSELFHHETEAAHPAPLLVTLHRFYPAAACRPDGAIGRSLRAAAAVNACSRAVLDAMLDAVPEIAGRAAVLLNALPAPLGPPVPPPAGPPGLLGLGMMVPHKGFDLALDAVQRLRTGRPGLTLTLAGDGEALPALRLRAAGLGLGDAVRFAGPVEPAAVPALIRAASLVLMPSRIEPFGLVALEAAQAGRPVVAAAVGGLPEVVRDGVTGLLVPPGDAAALAQATAALLDDPDRAARLGAAARADAAARFAWGPFVDAYDALYRRLARP